MKTKPVCEHCGGDDILADAYAEWDTDSQAWVLQNTFEETVCNDCGGECSITWVDVGEPSEGDLQEEFERAQREMDGAP